VRSQLEVVKKRLDDQGEKGKAVLDSVKVLDQKMEPVERKLIQVDMKSSEGNLGFPNMLNEQYDSFRQAIENADGAPTQSDLGVFDRLHSRLQAELADWKQIASSDVPAVNDQVRKENIPLVEATTGKE
jgi:phage tail tape-measure protein